MKEAKEVISEFCQTLGYKGEGSANDSLPPVRLLQLSKSTPSLVGPGKKVSSSYQGIINGAYALKSSPIQ